MAVENRVSFDYFIVHERIKTYWIKQHEINKLEGMCFTHIYFIYMYLCVCVCVAKM